MKSINYLLVMMVILPAAAWSWQWMDLWQTRDQQGAKLLQAGKAEIAANTFKDKNWQGVSHYRAGHYAQAFNQFSKNKTSDGHYNAGNASAFMGKYQQAIADYDKAIALNPNNHDAMTNREIIKKLLKQQQQQNKQNQDQQKNQTQQSQEKNQQQQKNQNTNQQQNQQANQQKNQQKNKQQSNQNQQQQNEQQSQQQSQNNDSMKNIKKENKNVEQRKEQDSQKSLSDNAKQNSNQKTFFNSQQQKQNENNKQLLRRLTDETGSLLQRKFLRDYARRHGME
jgi:Ca-activated chloride channel family protein